MDCIVEVTAPKETYPLLRDAYAIIDGIPEANINLGMWIRHYERSIPTPTCDTLACAAGWLMLHPQFQALGFKPEFTDYRVIQPELCVPSCGRRSRGFQALADLFGMTGPDAQHIFGRRIDKSPYDPPIDMKEQMTGKQLWQYRVRKFLFEDAQ